MGETAKLPFVLDPGATRAGAVRAMQVAFAAAGIESPDLDACRLLEAVTGADRLALLREPDAALGDQAEPLAAAARRRLAREPVSRILDRRGFYGRDFRITPDTLDPRPETETLIEAAFEIAAAEGWRDTPIRILDIGTGTGCLLVTLLAGLPRATGVGHGHQPRGARRGARQR